MDTNLLIAIVGVAVVGLGIFIAWMRKQDGFAGGNEWVERWYGIVFDVVQSVVDMLDQTVVKQLKADNDGVLTKEEAKKVFEEAYKAVQNLLSEEAKRALGRVSVDIDGLIKAMIESAVLNNRKDESVELIPIEELPGEPGEYPDIDREVE